jgi:hypothetical protein
MSLLSLLVSSLERVTFSAIKGTAESRFVELFSVTNLYVFFTHSDVCEMASCFVLSVTVKCWFSASSHHTSCANLLNQGCPTSVPLATCNLPHCLRRSAAIFIQIVYTIHITKYFKLLSKPTHLLWFLQGRLTNQPAITILNFCQRLYTPLL